MARKCRAAVKDAPGLPPALALAQPVAIFPAQNRRKWRQSRQSVWKTRTMPLVATPPRGYRQGTGGSGRSAPRAQPKSAAHAAPCGATNGPGCRNDRATDFPIDPVRRFCPAG
jgi:hypothetical protein